MVLYLLNKLEAEIQSDGGIVGKVAAVFSKDWRCFNITDSIRANHQSNETHRT
jgi:hypothetical protein